MYENKSLELYNKTSFYCSRRITQLYSTSFCSSVKLLDAKLREPIFSVYGFVRLADEIVDSFHDFDKEGLLKKFKADTYEAIEKKISLNPILQSFQIIVNHFNIDIQLINAFFESMEMDLTKSTYTTIDDLNRYIYGSAEVVGLICLHIFVDGNRKKYEELENGARALGAAFQKVNFLRDLGSDFSELKRSYFPNAAIQQFDANTKREIESGIEKDFQKALRSILKLPLKARFGVYVAYKYYYSLFKKIKDLPAEQIIQQRIRINDYNKAWIVFSARMQHSLNYLK